MVGDRDLPKAPHVCWGALLQDKDCVSALCLASWQRAIPHTHPNKGSREDCGREGVLYTPWGLQGEGGGRGVLSFGDWLLKLLCTILRDLKQSHFGRKCSEYY